MIQPSVFARSSRRRAINVGGRNCSTSTAALAWVSNNNTATASPRSNHQPTLLAAPAAVVALVPDDQLIDLEEIIEKPLLPANFDAPVGVHSQLRVGFCRLIRYSHWS